MTHIIEIDLVIKKNPLYGDAPEHWDWRLLGADTGIKDLNISVVPDRHWAVSTPAPRDWEVHYLTLRCSLLESPSYGYVNWIVGKLYESVLDKGRNMLGQFAFDLHDWRLIDAPLVDASYGDKAEPWPFKTDVVDKERIIPGGLTVAELREYMTLRASAIQTPEEALRCAVLDARFNDRDPVDAVVKIAMRNSDTLIGLAVAWLVDQIPSRTKED